MGLQSKGTCHPRLSGNVKTCSSLFQASRHWVSNCYDFRFCRQWTYRVTWWNWSLHQQFLYYRWRSWRISRLRFIGLWPTTGLRNIESSQKSYLVSNSLRVVSDAVQELLSFSSLGIQEHIMLDTGAPKSIYSSDWLPISAWKKPVQIFPIPPNFRPCCFAVQGPNVLYAGCFVANSEIFKYNHIFSANVFLPTTPIPYHVSCKPQVHLSSIWTSERWIAVIFSWLIGMSGSTLLSTPMSRSSWILSIQNHTVLSIGMNNSRKEHLSTRMDHTFQ